MRQIAYPYRINSDGRTAGASYDDHVRQMIEQVLFTSAGERVNRPDFGSGVMQLVFAPNSNELATATEYLVQGALQQWLAEVVQVEAVEVSNPGSTLEITVEYVVLRNQQRQTAQFSRQVQP